MHGLPLLRPGLIVIRSSRFTVEKCWPGRAIASFADVRGHPRRDPCLRPQQCDTSGLRGRSGPARSPSERSKTAAPLCLPPSLPGRFGLPATARVNNKRMGGTSQGVNPLFAVRGSQAWVGAAISGLTPGVARPLEWPLATGWAPFVPQTRIYSPC